MEFLAEKRKDNSRDMPSRVVETGKELLRRRGARLGVEQWSVREQVFLAALDTNELDVAGSMLKEIEAQFPDSQRAGRLRGLYLEAQGKTKEAAAVYDGLLKTNEINMLAFKRKICLLIAAGKDSEAVTQLTKYLDTFQADSEAWKQLALLHIQCGSFRNAVFCLEEVIISDPHSYISALALADAKYTLGGDVVNIVDARKYYSLSLHLKEGAANPRALWGMMLATRALDEWAADATDSTGKKKQQPKGKAGSDNVAQLVQRNLNTALNMRAQEHIANMELPEGMKDLVTKVAQRFSCKA
ncbi:ER membrane protein complex subunit 2 [Hondaea fermentalgiana]|uniref:ER membrane protein complex subunit 2 n=1 Tax=Hondaea fermentalgiana TaxID=2315210 RepID=A0A2R5GS79_9STRA|nr:ER membrane protein complex subunit 2 [Hondaea fermentalgiana]|eukprot:GBG31211.1 ER membrane protein complex subunit 2 [Hondaea fermentalgiana]